MKKILNFALSAFLAVVLLSACTGKQTNTYLIKGDVSGVTETGIAKLTQVVFDGEKRDRVDVASVEISNGEFSISGEIGEPTLMRLYVEVEDSPVDRADLIVEPGAEIDILYFGEIPGIWADGTGTHKTLISGYRFSEGYTEAMDEYTSLMLQRRGWTSRGEDGDETSDDEPSEEQVATDETSSEPEVVSVAVVEAEPSVVEVGGLVEVEVTPLEEAVSVPVVEVEPGVVSVAVVEAETRVVEVGGLVEGEEIPVEELPMVEFDEENVAAELERLGELSFQAYAKLGEAKQAFLDTFAEQDEDPGLALLALEVGAMGRTQEKIERLTQLGQVLSAATRESRIDPFIGSIQNHLERVAANDALIVGESVQDFTLASLVGNEHNLFSALAENDYVLVDFWASWCGPCIAQFPELKEVYAKHSDNRFEVINVSLDDNLEDWERASGEQELPWVDIGDMQAFEGDTAKAYGVTFIPKGYLIGSDGIIVAKDMTMEDLDQYLVENLGSRATDDVQPDQITRELTSDTQAIGS